MKRLCRAVAVAALSVAAPAFGASDTPPAGMHGLATRSVSAYLQRERALQQALLQRDRPALQALLADDFEFRTAADPDPLDGSSWIKREFAAARRDAVVRDLAVLERDGVAVVSFVLDPEPSAKGRAPVFVVDVWRGGDSRLLARYVDRPPPRAAPARPSGRE